MDLANVEIENQIRYDFQGFLPGFLPAFISDTTEFLNRCQTTVLAYKECRDYREWLSESNQKPIDVALETLKQCPEADLLWQKINQRQHICKILLPSSIVPTGQSLLDLNTIIVGNDQSEEDTLHALLFQMHKFLHRKKVEKVFEDALAGELGRETFTRQMAEIGFEGNLSFYELNKHCISEGFWKLKQPEAFLSEKLSKIGFEIYWSSVKKSQSSENNRMQWDKTIKPIFCEKHPLSMNCLGYWQINEV